MICPDTLIMSVTAAAISVAKLLDTDELELLAAVAVQFGDTLATLVTARERCEVTCHDGKTNK